MLERSPPPSPLPQVEPESPDHFTISQLLSLHRQLKAIAPSGFMLVRDLAGTLLRLAHQSLGGNTLPHNWRALSKEQVRQ